MGSPFKIPKMKQPSASSGIRMTSPLAKLQDDVTPKSPWNRVPFNKQKPNGSSCVNGRRETKPGFIGAERWRPKRASDKLRQREDDKHTPAAKKQCEPRLSENLHPSQPEDTETKTTASPVRDTQQSVNTGVKDKPNGRLTPEPTEDGVRATLAGTPADADSPNTRKLRLRLSLKTNKRGRASCAEPIVLSSGDEDEGEDEAHRGAQINPDVQKSQNVLSGGQSSSSPATMELAFSTLYFGMTRSYANGPVMDEAHRGAQINPDVQKSQNVLSGGQSSSSPATMELAFSTLYFGMTRSYANGPVMITEESISIQLKGAEADGGDGECVSVCVVPSELQAYGVWDPRGFESTELRGSSSSLLFFSLSDAQARLIHTELSALHKHTSAPPCPFVLVHLIGRLDELQEATLASLMDMMALRRGQPSLGTPLSQEDGLKRVLRHPRGAHFLNLLGRKVTSQESTNGTKSTKVPEVTCTRHTLRSHTRQPNMPRRLIQYPPPPCKGGITVTTEDLECLRDGEFLNDVIIDFYLKYLQLERADRDVAERSHIFSSFFYKQLTRKPNSSEEEAGGTAQYRRHGRVRTWTRNVDIFSKDYLFIPVNQEAHWYLVVICFPGLLQPECVSWKKSQTGNSADPKGNSKGSALKSSDLWTALCSPARGTWSPGGKPCILIMDSLKLSNHCHICTLLQEYLQVEWEVRRGTPRVFNKDSIKRSHCKVPLQDNSSDCGLYLLQYVESFLQNPIVHFDLPLRLELWFPRQQVRRKRAELRELVLQLYQEQVGEVVRGSR
ncbi:sentrin-specific protease 7b [Silurus meridionalis]|uniref:sentrin-specific protease 7b n=1 Tax=Silurus meridionalis TaxID=175797 RepID=UPI001EEB33BD|nr:sentrin-specific protease 7b [Silurus meridionalis]